jgi:uncharacterized RDD family membrane protein YckC
MSQGVEHWGHDDHNEATIETLRTPPLRIQPAPIRKRILAAVIDSIIICLAWLVVIGSLRRGIEAELVVNAVYLAVVAFAYYFPQEGLFSFTIGKRLLGLRVLGKRGDPASIRESLIRNFLRFVDWLPLLYVLGAVTIALSTQRQRLGDMAAGTVVTLAPEKDINPPPAPFLFH